MDQLEGIFNDLGIPQYLGSFVDQGFDSWETILDITESDLDALGVKLGHRRKLQRRIANYRGHAPAASLASPTRASIEDTTSSTKVLHPEVKDAAVSTKRKYRRHPKPDENAPERPPSAYVLFSNKMREDLKGQNLTFTEIAKLVGENWQSLDRSEKEPFEVQAQELKERYNRDMTEYKKTAEYKRYCEYLQEFRKRQAIHDASKRARVDGECSNRASTSSVSHGPSAANSNTGSGSESQPGSEPPPSRQQRLSSITSQSGGRLSPVVPTQAFPRPSDDTSQSPSSAAQEDVVGTRPRGFSSPVGRDASDHPSRRHSMLRDSHRPELSNGLLPPLSNAAESRITMAPISHSPEGGMPSIVPSLSRNSSNSRNGSASSRYWSRPPSLQTEQSSTGSMSSLSSYTQPRTPSESSLPIHALLSSKAETPTPLVAQSPDGLASAKGTPPILQQQPGRPPEDQIVDGRPLYCNGNYPSLANASQLPSITPLRSSVVPGQDQAMLDLPKPTGPTDPRYDGMSALLHASDIVGRQNH